MTVEGGATVAECCQLMAHSARLQGQPELGENQKNICYECVSV